MTHRGNIFFTKGSFHLSPFLYWASIFTGVAKKLAHSLARVARAAGDVRQRAAACRLTVPVQVAAACHIMHMSSFVDEKSRACVQSVPDN